MKKIYLFLTGTALLMIVAFVMPEVAVSQTDTKAGATASIPDDVNTIFKKACMDCHATGGKAMAMSHLNFSKWNEYSPDKQASKAEDILKELDKGKMPPKGYRASHPELIPTEAQIKLISDWSATLNKK